MIILLHIVCKLNSPSPELTPIADHGIQTRDNDTALTLVIPLVNGFNGIIVNLVLSSLHGGSLKITPTDSKHYLKKHL